MGLEYLYKKGEKACASEPLKVLRDQRLIGEIRNVKNGYQFFPKGGKKGGEVFLTVPDVQNSLQASQPAKKEIDEAGKDTDYSEELKVSEKQVKTLRASLEMAVALLEASSDLLSKQAESEEPINLLKVDVTYKGTEYDGCSVHGEIADYLESV